MPKKYSDPIIEKYIDLIRANTNRIKTFYQGEPVRIAASSLPACIIAKRETRVGPLSNSEDEHGVAMLMTVIVDIRKELSTEENDAKIVEGIANLYEIVEGRAADYTLQSNCILDILRSNIEVDAANNLRTDLTSLTRVDYGLTLKDRPAEEWSIEARIEFVAHFTQPR